MRSNWQSIGRGGMFEILADKYAGVNLLQIQRQDSSWGKSVAMDMSGGHVREGVATLEMHNKLYEQNDAASSMEQLLNYWNKSNFSLENRLILAVANKDVDALNAGARELLKSEGVLSGDEYKIGDDSYMRGDRIVIKESSKSLVLSNGEFGKIIEAEANKFTVLLDNGHKTSFNPNEYQGFRHGYASTVYKVQGASIEDVYVYHSGFAGSRNSYVALSRHVKDIGLYINKENTGSINQLVRQLGKDLDYGASINYKTADEFKGKENSRDSSMLGRFRTYAKEQFTSILDKYVPSSKYYRFEAPEESMEQVERVLVRNDNIIQAKQKKW